MSPSIRLLVTGGSGFIGTHVIEQATGASIPVANIDLVYPRKTDQAPWWFQGNVLDYGFISTVLDQFQPTAVIHLAAEADIDVRDVDSSMTALARNFPTNFGSIRVLADALRHSHIPLVAVSTQYVVGPWASPPASERIHDPYTPYGASKAKMETDLWESGLECWICVRPSYVWGAWHNSRFGQLVASLETRRYRHPSGKPVIRSYIAASTLARALLELPGCDRNYGRTIYGSNAPIDSKMFVDALSLELGGQPTRTFSRSALQVFAKIGDYIDALPLDSFRFTNMTTDYLTSVEPLWSSVTFDMPPLDQEVQEFAKWHRSRANMR